MHLISRQLYPLLTLLLLVSYLVFAYETPWVGDFWTHSAITRELSLRPFSPQNPFVIGGDPALPYWPYDALAALLSIALAIEPHNALALLGAVNLLFFLHALKIFCLHFFNEEYLPPLALVFILFCWGESPWFWSAVYSHQTFFYILPYPSFFAFALTLASAVYFDRNEISFVRLPLVSSLLLLVHPITFLFQILLLSSITVGRADYRRGAVVVTSLALSFIVGLIWPFFPLTLLMGHSGFAGDPNAQLIYMDVVSRIYPALFGLIPLAILNIRSKAVFITLSFGTFALYSYGWISERWNLGRVLPFFVFILQIYLGFTVVLLLKGAEKRYGRQALTTIASVVVLTCASIWCLSFVTSYDQKETLHELAFLRPHISDTTTVLSDIETSLLITSLGSRVVVIDYPPFIGGEYRARARNTEYFFSSESSPQERESIMERYKVDLVVLDERKVSPSLLAQPSLLPMAQEGHYHLFRYLKKKLP